MTVQLTSLTSLRALPFDDIIDVRSPAEFAEDHLPGAVSCPVLNNEERASVGTIYVQQSKFRARKVGAALLARNAARHLEEALADRDGSWRPLVYCWRGGQRSGSFAMILSQVGWRADTIEGGYRSYRRAVVDAMYDTPLPHRLILLDGNTGTAKTAFLAELAGAGHQVVDLEGLAQHRGSVFGGRGGQPSQKRLESGLAMALAGMDPARPVILEAESSQIGNLNVPPAVWTAMRAAPRLRIVAPLAARARYLAGAYADIVADPVRLDATLDKLIPMQGRERVAAWKALGREGAFEALAAALMEHHYDPRYAKQRERVGSETRGQISVDDLTASGRRAAVPEISSALERL